MTTTRKWTRLWRHLWTGQAHLQRQFTADGLHRIEQAIARSETRHSGELRFAVEASLSPGDIWQGLSARSRAIEVFSQLRIWDTEANNGVLIYLLMADHDVEILADRGIHAKVGAARWQAICAEMEQQFRAGQFEAGVLAGIDAICAELQKHFPPAAGDINELDNRAVVL